MSENKRSVEQFLDGVANNDHQEVLSCLTDEVEWEVPGMFHLRGKDAIDQEIDHAGSPTINIARLTGENDVVVVEGSVTTQRREGGPLNRAFCDVFVMWNGRIQHLTTYLMDVQ